MENTCDFVPIAHKLEDVYENINDSISKRHIPRYLEVVKQFKQRFGTKP
jgi:hypothetical protein